MARWVEVNLYPDEPDVSSKVWRYHGEVTLSMCLDSQYGNPRFEVTRILEDAIAVRALAIPEDVERGLEQVANGRKHVAEPFWHGYTPNAVRAFCRESRLPEPEGYAKAWRQMRRDAIRRP